MAKKDTQDTFIILLRLRLQENSILLAMRKHCFIPFSLCSEIRAIYLAFTFSVLHRQEELQDDRQKKTSGLGQRRQSEKHYFFFFKHLNRHQKSNFKQFISKFPVWNQEFLSVFHEDKRSFGTGTLAEVKLFYVSVFQNSDWGTKYSQVSLKSTLN